MSNKFNINRVVAMTKLKNALSIGKEVLETAKNLQSDWTPLNVAKEVLSHTHTYVEKKTNEHVYSSGKKWRRWHTCPVAFTQFIVDLSSQHQDPIAVQKNELIGDVSVIEIYDIYFKINDATWIYLPAGVTDEEALAALGRIFLETVGTRCSYFNSKSVVGNSRSPRHKFTPTPKPQLMNSKRADSLYNRILPFIDEGFNRSVFLHGPPGTGKTRMVEVIADKIGGIHLSFGAEHLEELTIEQMVFAVRVLNPTVLIINDIDRALSISSASMLEALEGFNKTIKLLIVTSNSTGIDPAAIRPGRFDEVIEIKTLGEETVQSMLEGFPEWLIDEVIEWPAAFIRELWVRGTVNGFESIKEELEDLRERVEQNNEQPRN